jgi:hypothetical protein
VVLKVGGYSCSETVRSGTLRSNGRSKSFGHLQATNTEGVADVGPAVATIHPAAKLNRRLSASACLNTESVAGEASLGDVADAEAFEWKYY